MIKLLDTTLREGEQTPGVTFTVDEKLKIASLLDEFGIDIIEAGHPAVSKDVANAIKEITRNNHHAEILAHSRALKEDINRAIQCNVDWVGIFFCVTKQRLKEHFKIDLETAIERITNTIEYAKDHGLKVRYTPEDTTRTEYNDLIRVIRAASDVKVDRISIADTVGATSPFEMYRLVKNIKSETNVELNVHCHNDLGLATANSLAAYDAGATMIDVTVNGLGERVGITSLSEICIALNCLYKVNNNWKLELLPELSKKVAGFSGINIPKNTPILGENAFSHKAGLHVSAVIKNPEFYEAFPAELIGRRREFTLDKMSGKQTIKQKIEQLGFTGYKYTDRVLNYVKSKEKGTVSNNEILQFLGNTQFQENIFQKCI